MGSPWRLREGFATSSRALHEDVAGAEDFEKPLRRLCEGFSHTHGGFAKASRRRHGRLHLETIRQIMTSPQFGGVFTRPCKDTFVSNFCGTIAFSRIAGSAAKERSVVAAGQLGSDFHGRKYSKHTFVLSFYSTDANLFRLSKRIAVRIDNSSLVEKGLLHEHVR